MPIVYLGLGSNMGDRQAYLDSAIQLLGERGCRVLVCSSVIETDPVGGPVQRKYLNAVVQCETNLSPDELLSAAKSIEKDQGRKESPLRNSPRPIDIDILLYDKLKIAKEHLIIPHPRMIERDFVMFPLKEIEPNIDEVLDRCL